MQLLNLMSVEIKRDLKEDNPKDDALTNTYNALKVCVHLEQCNRIFFHAFIPHYDSSVAPRQSRELHCSVR